MSMTSEGGKSVYNDIYFRIIIALAAAHIIVSFGVKESIFQLLLMWGYYRSVGFSFLIAFLLVTLVYFVTKILDKHYDWKNYTAERIGLQITFGLILPAVAAFLLATLYFGLFGMKILNTGYLRFDFPVIVIMLLLLNVYYLAFYFYRQWQFIEDKTTKGGKQKGKAVFVVHQGAKNIPLSVDTICYFYHDGTYNFARTFDRQDFLISQPLDEMQLQLQDKQFFRVNRQMIVNFTACKHFEPLEFGRLELFVTPTAKEPIIISQKRTKLFKEWIER